MKTFNEWVKELKDIRRYLQEHRIPANHELAVFADDMHVILACEKQRLQTEGHRISGGFYP